MNTGNGINGLHDFQVVVLDTDLESLPSADSLARAISRLRAHTTESVTPIKPTLQCANGQQGKRWTSTYYDIFATVLSYHVQISYFASLERFFCIIFTLSI